MRRPRLLQASVLALVLVWGVSACSDGSTESNGRPLPSSTSTATGNPFGEVPTERASFEPNEDRDPESVMRALYSLDPCTLLRASGGSAGGTAYSPYECGTPYDFANGFEVALSTRFDQQDRFDATRQVVNGVVLYREPAHDDPKKCKSLRIPTSFETALEVRPDYDATDGCAVLDGVAEKLTSQLSTDPTALQSTVLNAANIPPCTLLAQAYGELDSDQVIASSWPSDCGVSQPEGTVAGYLVTTVRLQITLTRYPKPASSRQSRDICVATVPGWPAPTPRQRDEVSSTEVEVSVLGTCAEAEKLALAVVQAARTLKPAQEALSDEHRFWYTEDENDSPVNGSCLHVADAVDNECLPMGDLRPAEADKATFRAASVNPENTCNLVGPVVAETFPDLTQISTGTRNETGACIFSTTAHTDELWVVVTPPGDAPFEHPAPTPQDGLRVGPAHGPYLSGFSNRASYGVSREGAGADLVLTWGSRTSSEAQIEQKLAPLVTALDTELLAAG